ncbi:MAG: putative ABC transporter permease [Bacilli bacterium]|nr:putative ABC transporter permease [Bacilli bacterium]
MEVICKLFELKKFVNRGFLIGPICPIYGYGVLLIVLLIGSNTSDVLAVFLKAILICSVLEYFTSYFMEKLFKARWWDYSRRKFNINGRICLETMLPFGILGCVVIYLLHPLIVKIVDYLNPTLLIIIAIILFVIYIIDNIVSFNVMNKIKGEIKKQAKDNTEVIRKKVLDFIDANSILYRHIKNAYPKFEIHDKVLEKLRMKDR